MSKANFDFELTPKACNLEEENMSDCLSVDTQEAFMEMIGLTSLDLVISSASSWDSNDSDVDIDGDNSKDCGANDIDEPLNRNILLSVSKAPKVRAINIPPKASRHHYHPSSCLALIIDDVLSSEDCQKLIQMAATNSGFRYIKEATHKTADGLSYMVQIQRPNPHKLAVIDTRHSPYFPFSHSTPSQEIISDFPTLLMDNLFKTICEALYLCPKRKPSQQEQQQKRTFFSNFLSREKCGKPKGLNPRMRILKYDACDNDRFEPHFDATTYISPSLKVSSLKSTTEVVGSGSSSSDEDDDKQDGNRKRLKSLITVLVYLNDGCGEDFEGGETLYLDYHDPTTTGATEVDKKKHHVERVVPKVGRIVLFEHDLFHSGAQLSWGTKYIMRTDILFEDEMVEEAGNSSSTSNNNDIDLDNNEDISRGFVLLHDVCDKLNLAKRDMQILDEMALLHDITCESFLSPGISRLKHMLMDGGMDKNAIDSLVKMVSDIIHSS